MIVTSQQTYKLNEEIFLLYTIKLRSKDLSTIERPCSYVRNLTSCD